MKYLPRLVVAAVLITALPALAGSLPITKPENVGMSSQALQRLHDRLQQLVDDGVSAGAQVVVARRGQVVMQDNFGLADKSSGAPITDDTLFRIYSMTKPVVGVAMMMLYEEGRFSLNDPIAKYIPAFEGVKVFGGMDEHGQMVLEDAVRPPNMHDVLQHSAGLSYGLFSDTPVDQLYRDSGVLETNGSLASFVNKLASMPLLFHPGTRYHYSLAVDVQGYLIERLSGMDAESYIRRRILEPLEMDETMAWVPADKAALLSKVHTHDDNGVLIVYKDPDDSVFSVNDAYRKPDVFSGGAQLVSTGDDYWRFAQMLLNGGTLNGERLLSPASVDMMTSNRLPETIAGRRSAPGWGHGFNVAVVTDPSLINYPASNGEFSHGGLASTHFWVDPEQELVVVMMSQLLPSSHAPIVDLIHRMAYAAILD
jgi:CubicO group peptidase (beta-lactamase class C family)